MPIYKIRTISTFEHVYEVFAENEDAAVLEVDRMLDTGDIGLTDLEVTQTFIAENIIPG